METLVCITGFTLIVTLLAVPAAWLLLLLLRIIKNDDLLRRK